MDHIPSPAASTNTRANGSLMSGFSLSVSAARAAATPRAGAPTLWVISQESLSVRGIAISFQAIKSVSFAHYYSSLRRFRPLVAAGLRVSQTIHMLGEECRDGAYAAGSIRPPREGAGRR